MRYGSLVAQLSIGQPRAATASPPLDPTSPVWPSIDRLTPPLSNTHLLTKQVPKLSTTRGLMMSAFSILAAPLFLLAAAGLMGRVHGQEIVAQAPLNVTDYAVVGAAGYAKGYAYFW